MEAARSLVFVGALLLGVTGALGREGGLLSQRFPVFYPRCVGKTLKLCNGNVKLQYVWYTLENV